MPLCQILFSLRKEDMQSTAASTSASASLFHMVAFD